MCSAVLEKLNVKLHKDFHSFYLQRDMFKENRTFKINIHFSSHKVLQLLSKSDDLKWEAVLCSKYGYV